MSSPRWRSRQPSTGFLAVLGGMALLLAGLQWTLVLSSDDATWNVGSAVGWTMLAAWYIGSLVRRLRAGEPLTSKHGDSASWWHL